MEDLKPYEVKTFAVGDKVVYKPYEGCSKTAVAHGGEVIEVLGQGSYRVAFGKTTDYFGQRIGVWTYAQLFKAD